MTSEPSAAWHPAMMPNSIAGLPRRLEPVTPLDHADQPIHDEEAHALSQQSPEEMELPPQTTNAVDAWAADGETGDDWLGRAPSTGAEETSEPVAGAQDANPAEENKDYTGTNSKHLSTMSFARSSHEVSFNDEEDGESEFEFTRSHTDAFRFMAPNDRTNSFPAVLPLEPQSDQPLPSTQAEEIIRELEQEEQHEEISEALPTAAAHADNNGFQEEVDTTGHQYVGGDLHGTVEEASEARFNEGIPLISQAHEETNAPSGQRDPFAEEDGGDDFFSKVRGDDAPDDLEVPPSLQRISTSQVMDGMGLGSKNESESILETAEAEETPAPVTEDLDSKWKQLFDDDDDDGFLLEDDTAPAVDANGFLGSDDEGLLDDTEEVPASRPAAQQTVSNQYIPQTQPSGYASAPLSPYTPVASNAPAQTFPIQSAFQSVPAPAPKPSPYGFGTPPTRPEPNKAQSFADKSKGGYSSPYDLPMDVVKPKKRASMHNLQRNTSAISNLSLPPAPPRSSSMQVSPTQPSGQSAAPLSNAGAPKQAPPARQDSFFEDLPMTAKPRPASRQSNKSLPSPSQTSPYGPPKTSSPPPGVPPLGDASKLVAPERVGPYAPLSSSLSPTTPSVPVAASTRYSPAPPITPNGTVPAALSSRYSPAPGATRPPSGSYTAGAVNGAPALPHLPRTSSPLAQFEISHGKSHPGPGEGGMGERRSSSVAQEARLHRVPSLPPTSEVEEEEGSAVPQNFPNHTPHMTIPSQRYAQLPSRLRQTPPPPANAAQATLSPPKRAISSYSPTSATHDMAPPPRSQTQSPGALYGERRRSADLAMRPSSVHGPSPPKAAGYMPVHSGLATAEPVVPALVTRPRGLSQHANLIPPTDGREQDPLQRWRGVPLFHWGVGGVLITSFPQSVPRYGINKSVPTVVRSPGEVKIKHMKDLQPLEERLAKFPGPLKGKSKKKEAIAWLTVGIEELERSSPPTTFQTQLSHEDKRTTERISLWKILRLFIEHDGVLDGNPTVESAVREILLPSLGDAPPSTLYNGSSMADLASLPSTAQADTIDASTVEQIRTHLLTGDREKAAWAAADKRMWGHALLIANASSPELYKQVTQEFVKKEVNSPGRHNESLATLYEVLSGNHEESVDELVPVHARAGLQLMTKTAATGPSDDAMAGLDKWRETLGLILSNRSNEDTRAINALGSLLSGYGRAEAAHICFLFAKNHSSFGGLDDPQSSFVLVGSDHKRQVEQFAKESEPLLLSEVYEYGLSLAGSSNVTVSSPHLAGYKFQHALTLAEYGYRDKALQYCEAIVGSITAQTRRAPYHHALLEATVDDLMKRLRQAPKGESNSWISKPSMNKVSDSVWNRFNKFVAGDENEAGGTAAGPTGEENGPFAHLVSGTPTISRSPSTSNFETFSPPVPSYPAAAAGLSSAAPLISTNAGSRYTPGANQSSGSGNPYEPSAYAPRAQSERASSELGRGSFEMSRPPVESQPSGLASPYSPQSSYTPNYGFQPAAESDPAAATHGYQPRGISDYGAPSATYSPSSTMDQSLSYQPPGGANASPLATPGGSAEQGTTPHDMPPPSLGYQAPSYGFEPPALAPYGSDQPETEAPAETTNGSSYEPPSFQSYEPPSYEPYNPPADDEEDDAKPKPKKRGPMYDDDDDDEFSKPARQDKSKSDKDRENEEMFRKIAEQEAKAEAEKKAGGGKKGWGFGGWFGGAKKEAGPSEALPNKPVRAKLGEANSFYFDPDLKRWVNKNGGTEESAKKGTPPPPKGPPSAPRSDTSTPPPPGGPTGMPISRGAAPPMGPPRSITPMGTPPNPALTSLGAAPPMARSVSGTSAASGPPSRPGTALSTSSSIDDLLGPAGARTKGAKKPRKSGRYVDVMAKP